VKFKRRENMFLRKINTKGRTYLNIVESYWDDGKPKHRSIASLGRLDKLRDTGQLRKIAMSLLKYCQTNKMCFDIFQMEEKHRKIWGSPIVYRKIWDRFKLNELFSKILEGRKIKFDFFSSVFLMVLDRLSYPKSKLKSYEQQNKYHGIKENELQHLYRAVDLLANKKEDIEKYLFDQNKNLFNIKVDVVFYDITTLYFESVKEDVLRGFGFSKDCKINEVQIILGLILDSDGRPIGYDIFPGSIYEGHTVKQIIEKLKKRFQINRLIFVGDRAILSKENLEVIANSGYEYIVGCRIKNKPQKLKEEILNEEGYIKVETEAKEEIFKYKQIEMERDRLICGWSKNRANKDKKDRERLISKASKMIDEGMSIISKRGALKYIEIKTVSGSKINEEKIKEDESWDGYYGIQTNCKFIKDLEVLDIYHQLWKIEEAFRILKSHLEARPIFHWTANRIRGHMMLCFVAFLLERTLEIELKKNEIEYSPYKVREALNGLQLSDVEIEGERFYIRSCVEGLANDILRILKIRIPAKVTIAELF
jgi:transposase